MKVTHLSPLTIGIIGFCAVLFSFGAATQALAQIASTTLGIGISIGFGLDEGGGSAIRPSAVVFSGFAYPGASLVFLKDNSVIGTDVANTEGLFKKNIVINSGLTTLSLYARDWQGLVSPTVNISIYIPPSAQVDITSIMLGPTITAPASVALGSIVTITGSGLPESTIRLFNLEGTSAGPATTVVDASGRWKIAFQTKGLSVGEYGFKANAQATAAQGSLTAFSSALRFRLLGQEQIKDLEDELPAQCIGSDFNADGAINIVDFSIMLFYWNSPLPESITTNKCVDLVPDGVVNLRDFSVLMHDWTG